MNQANPMPTVLGVDDRMATLRAMETLLANSPVRIETARSCEEAFSIALRWGPWP